LANKFFKAIIWGENPLAVVCQGAERLINVVEQKQPPPRSSPNESKPIRRSTAGLQLDVHLG
jgi:hypothetical protein